MENQFIFFSLLILKNYTHIVQDKSTFQTSIQASYCPLRFRIDYRRWRAIRDTFLQRDLEKPRVPVKMSRFSSRLPPMKLLLRFISDLPSSPLRGAMDRRIERHRFPVVHVYQCMIYHSIRISNDRFLCHGFMQIQRIYRTIRNERMAESRSLC